MFNIYYNKCRDITSVSLCSIVSPLFDPLDPYSHNPLYALRKVLGWEATHICTLSSSCWPGFFFMSNACVSFRNSQSIRRHPVATQCCSHSTLTSFSIFQHLVHIQPIKNGSLLPALLTLKWKPGPARLWHETYDINSLLRQPCTTILGKRDHKCRIMPNQQCDQPRRIYPYCEKWLTHFCNIRGSTIYSSVGKF